MWVTWWVGGRFCAFMRPPMGLGYRHQQIGRSPLSVAPSFHRCCGWYANTFWGHWSIKHPISTSHPRVVPVNSIRFTSSFHRVGVSDTIRYEQSLSFLPCFISMLLILSSSRKMEVVLWPHSRRHKENREFSQEIPMTLLSRRGGTCGSQHSLLEEIKASLYADGTTFPSRVLRPSTRCRRTRCRGLLPSSNLWRSRGEEIWQKLKK